MTTRQNRPRPMRILGEEPYTVPSGAATPQHSQTTDEQPATLNLVSKRPAASAQQQPDVHSQLQQAQRTNDDLRSQLQAAEQEKMRLTTQLQQAQNQLQPLRPQLQNTQAQLQQAQTQLRTAQAQLQNAQSQRQTAQAQLQQAQAQHAQIAQQLKATTDETVRLQAACTQTSNRLAEIRQQLQMSDSELANAMGKLNKRYAAIIGKSTTLQQDISADMKTITDMRDCEFVAKESLDTLEKEYEALLARAEQLVGRLRNISIDAAHGSDLRAKALNQEENGQGGTP